MDVEILYTDGCPHAADYLPQLRALLAAEGIEAPVRLRMVTSHDQARDERFLGSPTIRVNGRDVEPNAAQRRDYGLSCRLYTGAGGMRGNPPEELVQTALRTNPADDTNR